MAVATKKPQAKKADTKAAEKFVGGGLGRADDSKPNYTTVRFPARVAYLFEQMQDCVAARNEAALKAVSQNEWVLEAIAEKIEREQSGG